MVLYFLLSKNVNFVALCYDSWICAVEVDYATMILLDIASPNLIREIPCLQILAILDRLEHPKIAHLVWQIRE